MVSSGVRLATGTPSLSHDTIRILYFEDNCAIVVCQTFFRRVFTLREHDIVHHSRDRIFQFALAE